VPTIENFYDGRHSLVMLGSTTVAQTRARACVDDIRKLCASVEPGEGRVAGCVTAHLNDLSPPCQNLIAEAAAAAKACAADVKQSRLVTSLTSIRRWALQRLPIVISVDFLRLERGTDAPSWFCA